MLMEELLSRLERKDKKLEWNDIKRDLLALREIELETDGESYYLRTELRNTCYDVLSATGMAIPPRLRK